MSHQLRLHHFSIPSWTTLLLITLLTTLINVTPFTTPNVHAESPDTPTLTRTLHLYARADASVNGNEPLQNYGSDPLYVGPSRQSYLFFNLRDLPADATIVRADLLLNVIDVAGADLPQPIQIGRVDTAWEEATLNWDNQPASTPTDISTPIGAPGIARWDVKRLVRQWYAGDAKNYGFVASGADNGTAIFVIAHKESGRRSHPPMLEIVVELPDESDLPHPDVGDAPDSSNHVGIANTAYPAIGVNGNFPTVWQDPTGAPSGPLHRNETGEGWLGKHLSREREADMGADQDGVNNILQGGADNANNDRADDGWLNRSASFTDCQSTTLDMRISRAVGATKTRMYLNIWFDGNRDGDWQDGAPCENDNGQTTRAYEWIVQDYVVNMTAITPGSFADISINTQLVMNKTPDRAHWMRFTLSDKPMAKALENLPDTPLPDGRGPQHPDAYDYGETEDVVQRPDPQGVPGVIVITKTVTISTTPVLPGDVVLYTIEMEHVGGTAPAATAINDELPEGVHLVRRPRLHVESPRVSPQRVIAARNHVHWHGLISPNGKFTIQFPVRVGRCIDQETRLIRNVAKARQTDGSTLESATEFRVVCDSVTLPSDISFQAGFPQVNQVTDDTTQAASANLELRHILEVAQLDKKVPLRKIVTNNGPKRVILGFRYSHVLSSWKVEEDEPANAASLQSSSPARLGHDRPVNTQHIVLEPGETKTLDTELNLARFIPATDETDIDLDADLELSLGAAFCILQPDENRCPDSDDSSIEDEVRLTIILRRRDLGDAPSSTNHYAATMNAYPGVIANFPTVFDPLLGAPSGPKHRHPRHLHLGRFVSPELEADLGPDADPSNNIEPTANRANRDHRDDGIRPGKLNFSHCETTRIPVLVFISPRVANYYRQNDGFAFINMFVDGTRDGDWDDAMDCPVDDNNDDLPQVALEHIVIDHSFDPGALGPGLHTVIVKTGRVPWPADQIDIGSWLRVTLSERKSNKTLVTAGIDHGDGRGYHGRAFKLGETEDYKLRPPAAAGPDMGIEVKARALRNNTDPVQGSSTLPTLEFQEVQWLISARNVGTKDAENVVVKSTLSAGTDETQVVCITPNCPTYTQDGDTFTFDIGTVEPGEGGKVLLITHNTEALEQLNSITNQVEVESAVDVNPDNNQDEATLGPRLAAPTIAFASPEGPYRLHAGTTCNDIILLAGRARSGATVKVFVDGSESGEATVSAGGRWSYEMTLDEGTHEFYAVAEFEDLISPPSPTLSLVINLSLGWNPMSLYFADHEGNVRRPVGTDGHFGPDNWGVRLHTGATYTIHVDACGDDPNTAFSFLYPPADPLELSDDDNDGTFTGSFVAGEKSDDLQAMSIVVSSGDAETTYEGQALIDPEGIVYDIINGQLLAGTNVACMEAVATSASSDTGSSVFSLWPAADFGQVNPQSTLTDGYFSFWTPAGTYQLDTSRNGYQPYRSLDIVVVDELVRYDVPLTPVIAEEASQLIEVSADGFSPAVVTVQPGTVVKWVNVDIDDHTASSDGSVLVSLASAGNGGWDSGLLGAGESYKFRLDSEGTYTYSDRANPFNTATIVVEVQEASRENSNFIFLPVAQR